MLALIYRAAATWTVVGLASGLFYREFTKMNGVPGGTQLAVVHTHTLTLGTVMMLVLFAIVGVWPALGADRRFRISFWVWQAGLAITSGGMLVKGSLQVLGSASANSPAIAGVSGLGHMTLTVAFLIFFMALAPVARGAMTRTTPAGPAAAVAESTHEGADRR